VDWSFDATKLLSYRLGKIMARELKVREDVFKDVVIEQLHQTVSERDVVPHNRVDGPI
jgi:hypothetical protein